MDLKKMNKALKPICKAKQELNNPISRLQIDRKNPGQVPQWRWTKANGKLTRGNGKGINQYRYQKQVLIPKLIPFAQQCSPEFLIMEDNAPAHIHHANAVVINLSKVLRLLQCPNSPDLNMIKPAWFYLKRQTTKQGAPQSRKEAEKAQLKVQRELPQQKIREWIQQIIHHIQEVIRYKGGNEYKEGWPNWMKSREVNCIVKIVGEVVVKDEDKDFESVNSALW